MITKDIFVRVELPGGATLDKKIKSVHYNDSKDLEKQLKEYEIKNNVKIIDYDLGVNNG